jgi:hypothetical protein
VLFRLGTGNDIVTSPAEQAPYLYVASLDGYLYAMNELNGHERWRYSTGYPIVSSPAIVGDRAYVASLEPALHAIDTATGKAAWTARGVSHFAAQGKDRVYASDKYGNLQIFDKQTGKPLGGLRAGEGSYTLVNDQTDRIFVVHEHGLVQCLREMGTKAPTLYRKPTDKAAAAAAPATSGAAAAAAPAETTPPPAAADAPAEDEQPAAGEEAPAGAAPEETDNPFD